ncbi:MAG: hypothetical protein AMJ95_10125 [Omnitrophica WOR_2 bacterium SM23_72]|nr:MAG: hypothetical protein AMJ95_10125 [Omnitrophica WOR_2 bacterium SM23_72]
MLKKVSNQNYKLFMFAVLLLSGFLVYSNTFSSSFHFDDQQYIINNLTIRNIYNLQGIWNLFPTRFVTFFTFALNYAFHKFNVVGYHVVNLMIHLGSALLVWWFTRLILATPVLKKTKLTLHSDIIALFASFIFLTHPIQTQAVTYIFQRCSSLATFFYILCLCLYLKFRLFKKRYLFYAFSWFFGLAAVFTKETAATLPLMIILIEFMFLEEILRQRLRSVWPFLVLLVIIFISLFSARTDSLNDMESFFNQPSSARYYFLTQLRVLVTYLRLLFIPVNQNLDYDYPIRTSFLNLPSIGSFLLLASIFFWGIRLYRKHRLFSFCIFWFFLTLTPESSFIPLKDVIFEHRLYLPMVGFSLFITSGLFSFSGSKAVEPVAALLTCLVLVYSFLTYQRNKVWKDELTLWKDVVNKSGQKSRPYIQRGNAYFAKGDFERAISDYNKLLEIDSNPFDAYSNRGLAYQNKGDFDRAIFEYNKALEISQGDAAIYTNRGNVYLSKRDLNRAIFDYNKALEINPDFTEAYYNRGIAYQSKGDFDQAIFDYNRAIEINPYHAKSYNNRGLVYQTKGNFNRAISDYTRAIEIDPEYIKAYLNRGQAYFNQGNLNRAIADYTRVIQINPDFAQAYHNLALIYSATNRKQKAIEVYKKFIQHAPARYSSSIERFRDRIKELEKNKE